MEPIIVIVGFLGAGKTTVLKWLVKQLLSKNWKPTVILNDYENATLDSQQFLSLLEPSEVKALNGSCICCTGVNDLRQKVNTIPKRKKGITLIEANGTTDAMTLMEFLGVGISKHFLSPVQLSVVDCKYWQKRGDYNDLEINHIQVSSLVFLNQKDKITQQELASVQSSIHRFNPAAVFRSWDTLKLDDLIESETTPTKPTNIDHIKTHWSSCSTKLPDPISSKHLHTILDQLPKGILRVKGCTKLDNNDHYTFFEKIPVNHDVMMRRYNGSLISGPILLAVGPNSDPHKLHELVSRTIENKHLV